MTGTAAALACALLVSTAPDADWAPPARTVRVECDEDGRLEELATAVRAELAAAGFRIVTAPARDQAPKTAAVVTLRASGPRARVAAVAGDGATPFAVDLELGPTGVEKRVANRVAFEVAESLVALWLPPPAARAPPSPPPAIAQMRDTEPAPSTRWSPAFHVGGGMVRATPFPRRFGPELGFAQHGGTAVFAGATPFVRLTFAAHWWGEADAEDGLGFRYDVTYTSASVGVGLQRRFAGRWSIEVAGSLGLVVLSHWFGEMVLDPTPATVPGHAWTVAPGASAGLALHLGKHGALVLEERAAWLLPSPVIPALGGPLGGSHWPAIAAALAFRLSL